MSKFNEARQMIEDSKTDAQLYKAAEFIQKNSTRLGLDYVDLEKLQQIGMRHFEQMQRELFLMQKNAKAKRKEGK